MKQFEIKRKQIEYLSKVLEVILFLLIERSLGLEGTGFFLIPLALFYLIWSFCGESLPDALGKIIRIRRSKGQYKSIKKIRGLALFCQLILGGAGSVLMLFFGALIAEKIFQCPYCSLMIWLISPLIFLRGLTYLCLGCCQGEGLELPAVVTCLIRPVLIYGLGTTFGKFAGEYGGKVSMLLKQEHYKAAYIASGWSLAYTLAEVVMLFIAFLFFLGTRRKKQVQESEGMKASVSLSGYIGAVFRNMRFKTAIRVLEAFPVLIGMMIYYHRQGKDAPLTYATYFVGYFSVCLLLFYLMNAAAVPFWGKVAGFIRQDDKRLARTCFHGGIHILLGIGLLFSISFSVMAAQISRLAGFSSPAVVKFVVPGSFWILFMALGFYFSRMLMRLGKNGISIVLAILCDILFVMVYLILWTEDKMSLLGMMYASLISAAVYAILLGAILIQLLGSRVNWLQVVGLPVIGGALITALEVACVKLIGIHLKDLYIVVLVGGGSILLYWCGLLVMRNFSEEELSVIPNGNILLGLGRLLSVY